MEHSKQHLHLVGRAPLALQTSPTAEDNHAKIETLRPYEATSKRAPANPNLIQQRGYAVQLASKIRDIAVIHHRPSHVQVHVYVIHNARLHGFKMSKRCQAACICECGTMHLLNDFSGKAGHVLAHTIISVHLLLLRLLGIKTLPATPAVVGGCLG